MHGGGWLATATAVAALSIGLFGCGRGGSPPVGGVALGEGGELAAWAPDGRLIAAPGSGEINLLNLDGSVRGVSASPAFTTQPGPVNVGLDGLRMEAASSSSAAVGLVRIRRASAGSISPAIAYEESPSVFLRVIPPGHQTAGHWFSSSIRAPMNSTLRSGVRSQISGASTAWSQTLIRSYVSRASSSPGVLSRWHQGHVRSQVEREEKHLGGER
jgi:hypothetical protein